MGIRKDKLPHRLVYWKPTGAVKAGQPGYDPPVEMAGRWVPEERQVQTPTGSVITTKTTVWTEYPVLKNGVLQKGTLDGIEFPLLPTKNPDTYTVREVAHHDTVDSKDGIDLAFV